MGPCNSTSLVQTRGNVDLIYSSTSGTSKMIANRLQQQLEDNKYLVNAINIGDYDYDELINSDSTIIFLLSTYGDGASPTDGQKFYDWIHTFKPTGRQFANLAYAIIAFGNSSFENHCGFGLKTEKFIKLGGGKEIAQITLCDAASKAKDCQAQFPPWSKKLIEKLNSSHEISKISRQNLGSPYNATLQSIENFNWQLQASKAKNLRKDFQMFIHMYKSKVVFIKQMRKKKETDRSTLHIRLQIDKSIQSWPACNVQVFPMNEAKGKDPEDNLYFKFNEVKGKVPFPTMPIEELKKILNFTQQASNKQIKAAVLLSKAQSQKIEEYKSKIKQKDIKVTCGKLYQDLQPKIEFLPELGLNNVRTYTLSSWDAEHKYLDLCVSYVKGGLTSEYLMTKPQYLRIKTVPSTFYIPDKKRPIVMIANGSGIAPFRSIAQYVEALAPEDRPHLRLYYGIQNMDNDYYFQNDWKQLESKNILEVRLAQSRKDPNKKEYVQNVLQKDVDWLVQHLFTRNGVIFICGGVGMSQDVNNVIFKALTIHTKVPYKAFSLASTLKQKKIIVEEIFG